mmetsp:Transcript_7067/g.9069  ORF Transcript_7067/g.9069 Transcript_7067/m.9069 type:complete len:216 (-) Transcript_7067:1282-1929(-)
MRIRTYRYTAKKTFYILYKTIHAHQITKPPAKSEKDEKEKLALDTKANRYLPEMLRTGLLLYAGKYVFCHEGSTFLFFSHATIRKSSTKKKEVQKKEPQKKSKKKKSQKSQKNLKNVFQKKSQNVFKKKTANGHHVNDHSDVRTSGNGIDYVDGINKADEIKKANEIDNNDGIDESSAGKSEQPNPKFTVEQKCPICQVKFSKQNLLKLIDRIVR